MADAPEQPVYLITGADRPKIETALGRLRRHFAPEAIELVSALETSGEDAVALCNAGSLFGEARLLVVRDVDGRKDGDGRRKGGWKAADVDAVAAYLESPAPATVLALVAGELKPTSALWKACVEGGRGPRVRRREEEAPRVGCAGSSTTVRRAPSPKRSRRSSTSSATIRRR